MTDTYEAALARADTVGSARADDAAVSAQFCRDCLPLLVGAISSRLVWEGAQKRGLTFLQLGRLAGDPLAIDDLQWED